MVLFALVKVFELKKLYKRLASFVVDWGAGAFVKNSFKKGWFTIFYDAQKSKLIL